MKKAITTTAAAFASAICYAVGFVPQYVEALSFGEALRAMRLVGGSSNAAALMEYSTANAEVLAAAGAAFAVGALYTATQPVEG